MFAGRSIDQTNDTAPLRDLGMVRFEPILVFIDSNAPFWCSWIEIRLHTLDIFGVNAVGTVAVLLPTNEFIWRRVSTVLLVLTVALAGT